MLDAVFMMGGLGIIVGIGLAVASKVFYVWVDPKVEAVDEVLPGANCGGCGYPGCTSNAEAIVAGKSSPNSCVAAGSDVAEAIAAIMGVAVEAKEPDIAKPGCYYGTEAADKRFIYNGTNDCRAAMLLGGGMKVCTIGCLGLGSCMRACPFNAISMGADGLPKVDEEKCTGCGTCERVCPKHIISMSSVTRRILREYTTEECTTPCQRACPAGINIREYIRQITLGDYHRSVQVIKERNPFPTVIGRICPRPCEDECRRKFSDEPVAINFLKRFVADYERQVGKRVLPYKAPETGRKLAIVGGGVQGLSAAYFATRLGHSCKVFEATSQLGGLLRTAIARYRLPREVLDWDIDGILEMGVEAELNQTLGKDITIDRLLEQGYEAVFLASGGWDSRLVRGYDVEAQVPGTHLVIDLIKGDTKGSNKIDCDQDVVIVGGAQIAIQAANICYDLGSEPITIVYRESRENCGVSEENLKEAEDNDIRFIFNAAVIRLVGQADQLEQVEFMDLQTGEKAMIPANHLFLASGRFPELIFTQIVDDAQDADDVENAGQEAEDTPEQATGPIRWQAVPPYKHPDYRNEVGLLAQGDVLTDFSAAIKAIGAGRRAAVSLHQVINGISLELPENVVTKGAQIQNVDQVENVVVVPRQIMPMCQEPNPDDCPELEQGFTEDMAQKEASRCLQCGLICYERESQSSVQIMDKPEKSAA